MMDSATWWRTPAAASAARRLWPEVSKNSSTALSSNEGELARSITTCVPAMASLRPSPVMLLTPVLGEAATTSWPPWRRMETVFGPIRPVPPITTIFILDFSLLSQRAGLALDEGEKVGIDHVGVRRAHAMRELLVDLQGALPEELRGEQRGIGDRYDLVVVAVHDEGRHGADQHQLGNTALAVARDIVRRFAAAGRMANVDGITQIEMRDDRGGVRGVVVHVVTIADLARPAMAAPVMRNDAIALLQEVEHLGVPVVGAKRPAMMEDDGLRVPGTPVLVVDRRTILH